MAKTTWADLAAADAPLRVAVDTEYQGAETLTIQCAARVGKAVKVQVYHAAGVPPPKPRWFVGAFRRRFRPWAERVEVLPAKRITPDLSPARVVADLLGL